MKACIYTRVSTEQQELAQQIAACENFCKYRQFEIGHVYSDIMSGTKANRPEYQAMLKAIRAGEYGGVVVFRLDRLGRNSRELLMLVDELDRRGICVYSLNENLDTTTPIGKAVRDILLILAQLERDQIAEATKQRLQALKNLGKRLGRKEIEVDQTKLNELIEQGASVRKLAKELHVSVGKAHQLKAGRSLKGEANTLEQQPPETPDVHSLPFDEQDKPTAT